VPRLSAFGGTPLTTALVSSSVPCRLIHSHGVEASAAAGGSAPLDLRLLGSWSARWPRTHPTRLTVHGLRTAPGRCVPEPSSTSLPMTSAVLAGDASCPDAVTCQFLPSSNHPRIRTMAILVSKRMEKVSCRLSLAWPRRGRLNAWSGISVCGDGALLARGHLRLSGDARVFQPRTVYHRHKPRELCVSRVRDTARRALLPQDPAALERGAAGMVNGLQPRRHRTTGTRGRRRLSPTGLGNILD